MCLWAYNFVSAQACSYMLFWTETMSYSFDTPKQCAGIAYHEYPRYYIPIDVTVKIDGLMGVAAQCE